jgi:hypothetical protein
MNAMSFPEFVVDPRQMNAMHLVFDRVCADLQLRCDIDDPLTELIVEKIVALATAGEIDPDRLYQFVLQDLHHP